jgi:hypothetical protein
MWATCLTTIKFNDWWLELEACGQKKKSNQVVMRYLHKGTKHVWNQHPMVLVDQDFHFQNQVISTSFGLNFRKKK